MRPIETKLRDECRRLGLNYVGTRGVDRAPIVFVGEAPGAEEDQQGFPFVGASGQELDREIREAGIDTNCMWFTNPYKVRPPDNKLPRLAETGLDPRLCEAQFWEELAETKPRLIVACGQTPTNLLCPETVVKRRKGQKEDDEAISFSHWRGSLLRSSLLPWDHFVIPIYHPAFILRDYTERDCNVFVLRRVLEEFEFYKQNGKLQPLPERELEIQPTVGRAIEFLRGLINDPKLCGVDIEMLRRRIPYTIAIADSISHAMSICFWDYSGSDAGRIFQYLAAFLRKVPQVGQNYTTFDAPWLRVLGLPTNIDLVDDTLIRHHVLWPELSHKLEYQVMQYTREPFFKEEGRGWAPRDGKAKLMKYNCKDACTTLEIFLEQEKELDDEPAKRSFYQNYEMPLARCYYNIDQRGILFDVAEREDFRSYIQSELSTNSAKLATITNARVFSDSKQIPHDAPRTAADYLLSYPKDVARLLGVKGSTKEEELNERLAETGDEKIKLVLRNRELTKFKGTYVDQKLYNNISFTNYNVAGTLGGRRSARKNFLKFGSNHQNQPKHSDLAHKYRRLLIARPGKIFVFCDQVQAEDWIVNGIIADVSGIRTGLDELINGVDRHRKLAAFLFGLPESQCGKDTPQRFLGKKVRHAGNYDMRENRMAAALAKEGYSIKPIICAALLEKFHGSNPEIRGVFHEWVKTCLDKTRRLTSPLGRSRTFFGLHPYRDNSKLYKEAYSYVPQTTVGDNTGMAVLYCENHSPGLVVNEGHDSLGLEVSFTFESIVGAINLLQHAFDRTIRFENGLEINIPVEMEVGFDFGTLRSFKKTEDFTQEIFDWLTEERLQRASAREAVA